MLGGGGRGKGMELVQKQVSRREAWTGERMNFINQVKRKNKMYGEEIRGSLKNK